MRHLLGIEEGDDINDEEETVDEADDINDEDNQEIVETKKERETRVKNMLVQATKAHELMAEGKVLFPEPSSNSEED